jgi:hypothetical protein
MEQQQQQQICTNFVERIVSIRNRKHIGCGNIGDIELLSIEYIENKKNYIIDLKLRFVK